MGKTKIKSLSFLLALITIMASFVGCNSSVTSESNSSETEETCKESTEEVTSEQTSETLETESETEEIPKLEGENAAIIENAQQLSNGVVTYYGDPDRTMYTIENKNATLDYILNGENEKMVTALKNKNGDSYIEQTMDVFVKMKDGSIYYASNPYNQTRVNIYRFGYYYYDVHLLEQDFIKNVNVKKELVIPAKDFSQYKHTSKPQIGEDGSLTVTITDQVDPQVFCPKSVSFPAADYNNLQITIKSDTVASLQIYLIAGNQSHHNNTQTTTIQTISDGEYHTYNVALNNETFPDYTGTASSIRLDFGGFVGTDVTLKDVKVQYVEYDKIPLSLDRTFHTYSDKLHQELHIVAYENTDGINEIGMITQINAENVEKLIVKDKKGTHTSIENIDWSSAEYIGFDIINAGIFGYILPYDNNSGKITVSIENGNYVITQTNSPKNGTILAPEGNTLNDFRMGQRLYTDKTHSFDAFLNEAYCERNPLTSENIAIDYDHMHRGAKFKGYDALRGAYYFTVPGPAGGFNEPYYNTQNLYYNTSFNVTSDGRDRDFYCLIYTSVGLLECATVLDQNDQMLPIPLQVCKNFSEKEEPFYNCGDLTYGEVFLPVTVKAGEQKYLTVLDIYQNWGKYPLKQLSSIGYYMPYYHLSTGVTETNCISPWYNRGKNLWTLPDFRPMSMPASSDLVNMYPAYGNQPQRPNAGYHVFLRYTDSNGNFIASDNTKNTIMSYGPTYADVVMDYISDDGKIKVSYRHLEMPQTDENRTYYEITYEVLDTVQIENFRRDFSFYTMTGFQSYSKIGFLNKNNEPQISSINEKTKPVFRELGKECPYFSMFYISDSNHYANLAFLIYDSEIIINGEKRTESFAIVDSMRALALTLNIDEAVTLQKGDKFTINCILLPWGGSWTQDDGKIFAYTDDLLVQNVRTNTLLNPFSATPKENCEKVDSVFLPRLKTTNGKDASFTVSGGCDLDPQSKDEINVTVRADGFDKLSVPVIEEYVDGKWISYEVSSKNSPDSSGNSAEFDGYGVHYDGDGTYSYSFVTTISDGKPRTFRITVQ